ncbi:MAG: LytTR family DNA-binding domain-containing protein [Bacteroidales bacterium]|nr:LytTR family DNA-binding domain-containing protein [Bacteroidales bacterium]
MNRNIPKFMTQKRDIFRFMCFVVFFVIIFSLIYHPDVAIRGFGLKENQYRYYLTLMISIGFLMLVISRITFYKINQRKKLTFNHFCWWIVQEMVVISFSLSIVARNLCVPNTRSYLYIILPRTTISVVSLLIIPYIICWLYFALEEKNFQIKELIKHKEFLINDVINFNDEKGVFRLSVRLEDLLYIQSADNYIFIYYLNNRKEPTKYMLRNTLKYIEENFSSCNLIRCHRFYIVNLNKVKVLRKTKEGLILELDTEIDMSIPVSKTYGQQIAALFTKEYETEASTSPLHIRKELRN